MPDAQVLVSEAEYLQTSYEVDCDYVDGRLEERNVGERLHGELQEEILAFFRPFRASLKLRAIPEQRLRIRTERYRVPDICVTIGRAQEPVLSSPPFLCIEILSPEDRLQRILKRCDDCLAMGVRHVWIIDPYERAAYYYREGALHTAKDGLLRTADPDIVMNVEERLQALEEDE
jgi:Uma2 family endonuclease